MISDTLMPCVPDEHVRTTGVYEVLHFGHRPPHEVFLWQHEIFPPVGSVGAMPFSSWYARRFTQAVTTSARMRILRVGLARPSGQ